MYYRKCILAGSALIIKTSIVFALHIGSEKSLLQSQSAIGKRICLIAISGALALKIFTH